MLIPPNIKTQKIKIKSIVKKYSKVRFYSNSKNSGPSRTRNYGVQKSKGKIISCSTAQAIMGFPNHSGYVASKHALHGFLETISMENIEEITVLEAVLSWIRGTNLRGNSFRADGKKHKDETRKHTSQSISLESCVKSIINGVKTDKKTRGTEIILNISKDSKSFLEEQTIGDLLKKYNRFMPIPIKFGTKEISKKEGEGKKEKEVKFPCFCAVRRCCSALITVLSSGT